MTKYYKDQGNLPSFVFLSFFPSCPLYYFEISSQLEKGKQAVTPLGPSFLSIFIQKMKLTYLAITIRPLPLMVTFSEPLFQAKVDV